MLAVARVNIRALAGGKEKIVTVELIFNASAEVRAPNTPVPCPTTGGPANMETPGTQLAPVVYRQECRFQRGR